MLIAYGELKACCDLASGSVYMVVVRTPYLDAVLPTRLLTINIINYIKRLGNKQCNFAAIGDQYRIQGYVI